MLYIQQTTKALIRLKGCAGWSAPLLLANPWRQVFFHRGPNIFVHILILQEYWVLTERRIPLKLVIGGVRIVAHFPCVLMNSLNNSKSATFLFWRFSLFLKDPLFQVIYLVNGICLRYLISHTTCSSSRDVLL